MYADSFVSLTERVTLGAECVYTSSPWQKSSRIGNAGETACATIANQQFAAQVGQAFSLPGLLPRAATAAP
ncbi:MAG TPA: hypothetical protein VNV86_04545 [Candidatus Acidoferrum sp.]|nr:hypothetical protein [Candidatus Acidoferrum sp.]